MKKLILALLLTAALGTSSAMAANMIATEGLSASGKEKTITVGSVSADKAGYLVVHEVGRTGTVPGAVIGNAPVKAGENTDVKISLDIEVTPGTKLIVMLHEDTNGDSKFDPGDKAATEGRAPVQQMVVAR